MDTKTPTQSFKVFITGIDHKIQKAQLLDFFKASYPSAFKIKTVATNKNQPQSKRQKKNAILFLTNNQEKYAIIEQDTFHINNTKIYAKPFFKGKKLKRFKNELKSKRIFVHNIPFELSKADLSKIFGRFGKTQEVIFIDQVKENRDGQVFKHGYVKFEDAKVAEKLIKMKWIEGGNGLKLIIVAYEDSPEDRRGVWRRGRGRGRGGHGQRRMVRREVEDNFDKNFYKGNLEKSNFKGKYDKNPKRQRKRRKIQNPSNQPIQQSPSNQPHFPDESRQDCYQDLQRNKIQKSQKFKSKHYQSFQEGPNRAQLSQHWRMTPNVLRMTRRHKCLKRFENELEFCSVCCASLVELNHVRRGNLRLNKRDFEYVYCGENY
jgi:hypothetical protein